MAGISSANDDKMRFVGSGPDFNQDQSLEGDMSGFNGKSKSPASLNVQMPSTNQTSVNMGTYKPEIISTLDEPVSVTINRDLKAVVYKLGHVFFPKQRFFNFKLFLL